MVAAHLFFFTNLIQKILLFYQIKEKNEDIYLKLKE